MDKYRLTPIDGFFLTFIAAWLSIKQELWSKSSFNMFFLIVAIFCFSAVVAQLRFFLAPRKEVKDKNILGYSTLGGLFLLTIFFCYFMFGEPTYFSETDVNVLLFCAVIWAGQPIIELFDRIWHLRLDKNKQDIEA